MGWYGLSDSEHEIMIGQWTENLVENEYQGSLKNFLLAFTRRKSLTRTEADELRKILDEKEE